MGFLSSPIEDVNRGFDELFATWKDLYYRLNGFCMEHFLTAKVTKGDTRSVLIYACFYRMLTTYQSAFILIRCASDTESKALLRNLLETLFVLKASIDDKEFYKLHIRLDERKRMKFWKEGIKHYDHLTSQNIPSPLSKEKVDGMRKTVATYEQKAKDPANFLHVSNTDKAWSISKTAELAGLIEKYDVEYAYLCTFTHPSPNGMTSYLSTDTTGEISGFRIGPVDNDAGFNLKTAVGTMLYAMGAFARHFGLQIEKELQPFWTELNALERQEQS